MPTAAPLATVRLASEKELAGLAVKMSRNVPVALLVKDMLATQAAAKPVVPPLAVKLDPRPLTESVAIAPGPAAEVLPTSGPPLIVTSFPSLTNNPPPPWMLSPNGLNARVPADGPSVSTPVLMVVLPGW